MQISQQPAYIYDVDKRKTYVFDGVIKIQHTQTLKIEDDPSAKKGKNYVNNAQNEPDEITLDVAMSNVFSGQSDITAQNSDRSKGALATLMELKKARRKVQVVTYYATYSNMLLKSISVVQDETNQYGWTGQVTFHEAVAAKGSGGSAGATVSSVTVTDASGGRTPSVLVRWFGANAI